MVAQACRRAIRLTVAGAALSFAFAVHAGVADASSVYVSGSTLYYAADPGEDNHIQVNRWTSNDFTILESPILVAGSGCHHDVTNDYAVDCSGAGVTAAVITLGDQPDNATVIDNGSGTSYSVSGGDGNDTINSPGTVTGGNGDDTLNGTNVDAGPGNDVVGDFSNTGWANVSWSGGPGDDLFYPTAGADTIVGGDGIDTVNNYHVGGDVSLDDLANDGPGHLSNIGSDVENVTTTGNVSGSSADNVLVGAGVIEGLGGNDTLYGSPYQSNTLSGGSGDDMLSVGFPWASSCTTGVVYSDNFSGGPGIDTVSYASSGADLAVSLDDVANDGALTEEDNVHSDVENVTGGCGNDLLVGNAADNTLDGGLGDDVVDGGLGSDMLIGGPGEDAADYELRTAAVTVTLDGLANDGEPGEGDNVQTDDIYGGAGNDHLTGDANDNLFDGGPGADVFVGGGGEDAVDYSLRTAPVTATLDGIANDGEAGEGDLIAPDIEDVFGGSGDDHLTGDTLANYLDGGPGADVIDGQAGADSIFGGPGADTLIGGPGQDAVSGETGDDVVQARDGEADTVSCGDGSDVATADLIDFLSSDCEQAHWGPPSVFFPRVVSVTETTATVDTLMSTARQITAVHAEAGLTTAYGLASNTVSVGASSLPTARIQVQFSGLQPGTTYHFRFAATNGDGTAYGVDATFTTAGTAPVLVTPPVATRPPACVVPYVVRRTTVRAKRAITKAHCRVGRLSSIYSLRVRKGHVIAESPRPGRHLRNGTRVNLVVSKGPRPSRLR